MPVAAGEVAFVLKGYPRLSETFIAQEIRALEQRGLAIRIVSLRKPTDRKIHGIIAEIRAAVSYLPEYLWREPGRLFRGWRRARRMPGYRQARRLWLADLRRDFTPNRGRRFGQALVLAAELPASVDRLHAHFLHTPASVARYAALIRGLPWSVSAHAKDIWITPDWEKREKLTACNWLVTCTEAGARVLDAFADRPGKVLLARHGLDLARFPEPRGQRSSRNGGDAGDPVVILSVGRAVEKKGYDDLLAALAKLPAGLAWRFRHIGGGPLARSLHDQARALGIVERIEWLGPQADAAVLTALREADLFVLACRIARDGDRDGLPNALVEAGSQGLPLLATRAGAIEELIEDGETGLLVPPSDSAALSAALTRLARDPALRIRLGEAAMRRVRKDFAMAEGIERLARQFGLAETGSERLKSWA